MDALTVIFTLAGVLLGFFVRDLLAARERRDIAEAHSRLVDMLVAKTPEQYSAWKQAQLEYKRAEAAPPKPQPTPPPPWEEHPDYQGKVSIIGDQAIVTDDEGVTTGGIASIRRIPLAEWNAQWGYKP